MVVAVGGAAARLSSAGDSQGGHLHENPRPRDLIEPNGHGVMVPRGQGVGEKSSAKERQRREQLGGGTRRPEGEDEKDKGFLGG